MQITITVEANDFKKVAEELRTLADKLDPRQAVVATPAQVEVKAEAPLPFDDQKVEQELKTPKFREEPITMKTVEECPFDLEPSDIATVEEVKDIAIEYKNLTGNTAKVREILQSVAGVAKIPDIPTDKLGAVYKAIREAINVAKK